MGVKKVRTKEKEEMKGKARKQLLDEDQRNPFVYFVAKEAAMFLKMDLSSLLLGPPSEKYSTARYMVMYAVNILDPIVLKELGMNLNYKEHTSVIHGLAKINDVVENSRINKSLHKKVIGFMNVIRSKYDVNYISPEKEFNLLLDAEALMILDLENMHNWKVKYSPTHNWEPKSIENQL